MNDYIPQNVKSQIPALETLKLLPQWVFYKNEVKKAGEKPAKMPKSPHTGYNAKSTDKMTWASFLNAVRAKKRYQGDGLGWVFTEEAGIVGIDLDDCIDEAGQFEEWATKIVDSLRSYTEISPSGRGLHIFAYGKIPKALGPVPGSKIEIYNRARYFTVTGDMLPGSISKISERQDALDNLWQTESKRRRAEKVKKSPIQQPQNIKKTVALSENLEKYTEKALLDEIATLSMATEGCRNDTLNRCAFNLGQFIEAGLLDQTETETTLLSLGTQLGLSQSEAEKTITSGIRGGINNPRANWPERNEVRAKQTADTQEIAPELPKNDIAYHQAITTEHLELLKNQWGLSSDTVNHFKVGYCGECPTSPYSASFVTPYYDIDNLVDIRHHLLAPNGQGSYRPEIEGYPPHLFNLNGLDDDWAILVNREPNTMLLYKELGLPTVGLPSTFKVEWLAVFDGLKKVFIALDPGQRVAARRIGRLLVNQGIDARISTLPFSPVDMMIKYGCSSGDFFRFIEQSWGVV
jgi:hypothetical protein